MGPLNQAVSRNDLSAATALLDAGTDPNAIDDRGELPIFRATSLEMITLLVGRGANVNLVAKGLVMGVTPLMVAAGRGNVDVIRWLLEMGADPRLRGSNPLGSEAPTALASAGGACVSSEAAEALIKAGASTPTDLGEALLSAVLARCMELARRFIARGADVNLRHSLRNTALHAAAIWGNTEAVELLLAHGADPTLKNQAGRTPRAETDRRDLRKMLEDAERKKKGR